jgi:hypothetical protein
MKIADIALGFSLLAGFGLFLVYVFQIGIFSLIGFEYAGLMGALDFWSNIDRLLPFALGIALMSLVILMLLQWLEQTKSNPMNRISNNSWWIQLLSGAIIVVVYVLAIRFDFAQLIPIVMAAQLLITGTCVYCAIMSQRRVLVWDSVLSVLLLVALSFVLGMQSGYQNTVSAATYDIHADGRDFKNVRLVRSSPGGVIYWQDGGFGFLSAGKIISIARSKLPQN